MAKRIYINQFRFYIRIGAFPFLIFGGVFLIYPKMFFSYIKLPGIEPNFYTLFFLRLLGSFLVYIFLTFIYLGWNPNYHRDLAFFQSLLLLTIGILTGIAPFLWEFHYYTLIISIYSIIFGIFLIMFSSKNLLVRD